VEVNVTLKWRIILMANVILQEGLRPPESMQPLALETERFADIEAEIGTDAFWTTMHGEAAFLEAPTEAQVAEDLDAITRDTLRSPELEPIENKNRQYDSLDWGPGRRR
jgi:hypothetical protein